MDTLRVRYDRDGFVVIPDFVDAAAMAALRARAEAIVAETAASTHGTFSARQANAAQPADDSFLTSGYAVRAFYEEGAFDERGALRVPHARAINKIGHALHDLDPVFAAFTHSEKLDIVTRMLGLADPRIYQSTYIFKQPRIGGDVRCHQDATYFDTDPQTVTAFWFALDDADAANGCLVAQAGTHRGPLRERFVRDGDHAALEPLDATPWPALDAMEPIAVRAGALVIMHGLLPHASGANTTDRSRHAYIVHAVDGVARYSPRNWLQRHAVPPTGFRP